MRLRIRSKLILFIGVPLLLVYLGVLGIDYVTLRHTAVERLRARVTEEAVSAAAHLDAHFQQAAQLAQSTAAFVSLHADLTERELYELIQNNLALNALVYGSCIAFEPHGFAPERRLMAPYVHREADEVISLDIGREAYDYTAPKWEWYRRPKESGKSIWTAPYFDDDAGNILMCTYSVPFYRGEAFRGVATVDIPLATLQEHVSASHLHSAPYVIVGQDGTFISHPDPTLIMKETVVSISGKRGRPEIGDLFKRVQAGETGVARLPGLTNATPRWVSYAPIQSTGWYFLAAIPESEVTRPIQQALRRGILIMLLGLAIILGIMLVVAVRITQPVARLTATVRELGRGNLNTQVTGVSSKDELDDLARVFNLMIRQLKTHIKKLTEAREARETVDSELQVARRIQASLLPRTFPPFPRHDEFELHAINVPARQVAGDFFDFFFLSDNILAIVIADVSGKGVPAGLFMAVTRTILRGLGQSGTAPGDTLTEVNQRLVEDNEQGLFVTLFLGHYDTTTGTLRYANAGHCPPYRVDDKRAVHRFPVATGIPLGIDPDATYAEGEEVLAPNDLLVLYTDGVTEARTPDDQPYGDERFEKYLREHGSEPAARLCAMTVDEMARYQAREAHDDVTLLMLRRIR